SSHRTRHVARARPHRPRDVHGERAARRDRHPRRGARKREGQGDLPGKAWPEVTLEVSGLHAGYATARVLNGVDFTVESGQSVALLGRNGMGKTTLVRAICGLLPPVITAGTIT